MVTRQEITNAVYFADRWLSQPWARATGEWLFNERLEGGDITTWGPYEYHRAVSRRRCRMLEIALVRLGFEDDIQVLPEDVAGMNNVRAINYIMQAIGEAEDEARMYRTWRP